MHRALTILFYGVCAWYVLLIGVHFFHQRPLWNDETCVLNSIQQLSPGDLFTRSLLSDQAFPRCYLWTVQQFSQQFQEARWALRLFPLMCMGIAFMVWMSLARCQFSAMIDRFNFALCWAASIPLVYYAAELKQYSMDVLAAAVLVYLMLKHAQGKTNTWLFCLYPFFGLVSYPAIFLMLVPLAQLYRHRNVLMAYVLLGCMIIAAVWAIDARHSPAYLLETYWHDHFISFVSAGGFFKTLGEGFDNLTSRWFVELPKVFRAFSRPLMGAAIVYMLFRGMRDLRAAKFGSTVHSIGLMIFVELFLLGILRKFPFTVPRMSLFFAPLLMWCGVEGLSSLRIRYPKVYWPLQIFFWVYLTVMTIGIGRELIVHGDLGAQSAIC